MKEGNCMEPLFWYLTKSGVVSICSRVGEFLKGVVGEQVWKYDDQGNWICYVEWSADPIVLNELDRNELACRFYHKETRRNRSILREDQSTSVYSSQMIIDDISKQIDLMIPRRYFMLKEIQKGVDKNTAQARSKDISIKRVPELIYHYEHK